MIDPVMTDPSDRKHELAPHVQMDDSHDAGTRARMKMNARIAAQKAAAFTKKVILLTVLAAIATALAVIYYGHETRITGTYVDHRECSLELQGDYTITGKRTYTYPYVEVFGFRVVQTGQIDEVTQIDLKGTSIVTIGQTNDEWWAINNGTGERGIQILKPANSYSFVVNGDRVGVVTYKSFCR